ncbi:putative exported protein [Halobacteriovorax marinus SJ]|uniref:Exported protein n=1 Tax=Halobacteriovorax marinus (strain ATCC BAA-682 / DSM 15412 / SJ) TaxID=862908 RepID=E1X693_HALMS|nr:TonB C-terminal domain-containing protein [Halobacteriovorax marinus]CBW27438.1 putative exported protein [Halobacteriovorax marinus SJ]
MNSWAKIQMDNYGTSLVLSILINIILMALTSLLFNIKPSVPDSSAQLINGRPVIKVKSFRTVGVKNGNKKTFSVPTKSPSKKSSNKTQSSSSSQSLDLSQLGSISKEQTAPSPAPTQGMTKYKSDDSRFKFEAKAPLKQRLHKQQQQLQGDVLKQLAANPSFASALSNKGFNVQFDPPEGIPEDELNSVEKIFYSFQKRTYETYLNSFLKTYYNNLTANPNLRNDLSSQRHRLNARVQFDKNGHILSVKILKSSNSDSVHDLFETTLDAMRSIPNPPKDLLGKDGNFTIYYSLYIN